MATKAKTDATPAVPAANLEERFSKALPLLEAGKYTEAAATFEALLPEAREQGKLGLARALATSLAAAQERLARQPEDGLPEVEAQYCLNRNDPDGAMKILEKALKDQPERAQFHYLKALALAQRSDPEASAAALGKAVELDPAMLFPFHLEPDFNDFRNQASFQRFAVD